MFCLRTLRELKLLKFLSEAGVSENVRLSSLCALTLRLNPLLDHFHFGHHQTPFARGVQGGLL